MQANDPHALPKKKQTKTQTTNTVNLGAEDKRDIIYCPGCKCPVVDSEYGIRRHIQLCAYLCEDELRKLSKASIN